MRRLQLLVALMVGVGIGVQYSKTPPLPMNPVDTEIDLIGVTPEGVKLYKIKTPKGIVPTFVGVAPNGSIAIR